MKPISNKWTCLLDAFREIIPDIEVTHDGAAIKWPHHEDPMCRQAFHIDEMLVAALRAGWIGSYLTWTPRAAPSRNDNPEVIPNLEDYRRGVITQVLRANYVCMGVTARGTNHAQANSIKGFKQLNAFVILIEIQNK